MLFNSLLSMYPLCLLTLLGFFALFVLRHLYIKRTLSIVAYHVILFGILFMAAVVGGSVQNYGYLRLEKYIAIENNLKNNQEMLKSKDIDSMLAIDFEQFKTSDEFKTYLKEHDAAVDKSEALFIGWIFVLLSDIGLVFVCFLQYAARTIRNRFNRARS